MNTNDNYLCDTAYSAFIIEDCNVAVAISYVAEELIPAIVQETFTLNDILMSMELKRKKCYLAVSMKFTNGKYGCQIFEIKKNSSIPSPGGVNLSDIVVKNTPVVSMEFVEW